jgi:hypothetical protein
MSQQSLQRRDGKISQPLVTRGGVLTLLQVYDQQGFAEQYRKGWVAEEETAPPATSKQVIEAIFHDRRLSSQA